VAGRALPDENHNCAALLQFEFSTRRCFRRLNANIHRRFKLGLLTRSILTREAVEKLIMAILARQDFHAPAVWKAYSFK